MGYPINNFSTINFFIGYPLIREVDEQQNISIVRKENIIATYYIYNTLTGKYIEPVTGVYCLFGSQISGKFVDGDYLYQIYSFNFAKYLDLGKEHCITTKLKTVYNYGRDKRVSYIYGYNNVRGEQDKTGYESVAIFSITYRIPIIYDINYHMWYLFPDLFFKGFYIEPFMDTGCGYNYSYGNYKLTSSLGINFKLHSFVLQTYLLTFNLTFAKKLSPEAPIVIYFTVSSGIDL